MSSYHVSIRRLADSFKTTLELWKLLEAKPTNDMNLNYEILVGYSNRPVLILNLSRQFNQPDKNWITLDLITAQVDAYTPWKP